MNFKITTKKVEEWAIARGMFDPINGTNTFAQISKLTEEFGELAAGFNKNKPDKIRDSFGDMLVIMTILGKIVDMPLDKCFNDAYIEIKDRKGKMIKGIFVKEADLN